MTKKAFRVNGMTCGHCAKAVQDAALGVNGIAAAKVKLKTGELIIKYGENAPDPATLQKAIAAAGFGLVL
ncbi:MAG: heavy-metal-associated domain-containing protein [Clostridiales bacterium]|jgi:copper chaperone|nr:heavy-metal-associated domain-containing protein [Clostridiales bacterium]